VGGVSYSHKRLPAPYGQGALIGGGIVTGRELELKGGRKEKAGSLRTGRKMRNWLELKSLEVD
jgi:hypothetical protein